MARLPQGILGGVVGSVGNLVGTSWKGIPIIKTKPLSVANPKTAKQIAQRTKMSNIVAFSQPILSTIIKPLNDRFAQRQSGYNLFVSRNIQLFTDEYPSPASELVISRGKLGSTSGIESSGVNGENNLSIGWSNVLSNQFMQDTDIPFVLAVNKTNGVIFGDQLNINRGQEGDNLLLPYELTTGDKIDVYLAFMREDGTMVSDTDYVSVTV